MAGYGGSYENRTEPNSFHCDCTAKGQKALVSILCFYQYRNMENISAVKILAALAQNSRMAIFRYLVEVGPAGAVAGRIADTLGIAPAVLSFHMKELSRAELVESTQDGRFVRYVANFSTMNAVIAYLTENCCGGQPELCATPCPPTVKPRTRKPAH
jgi:ArsR family transcriptional regulator